MNSRGHSHIRYSKQALGICFYAIPPRTTIKFKYQIVTADVTNALDFVLHCQILWYNGYMKVSVGEGFRNVNIVAASFACGSFIWGNSSSTSPVQLTILNRTLRESASTHSSSWNIYLWKSRNHPIMTMMTLGTVKAYKIYRKKSLCKKKLTLTRNLVRMRNAREWN